MPIKKYVNFESDSNNKELGRKISMKIKLKLKKVSKVYIVLEPDKKNKDPKKLNAKNRAGIDSTGQATYATFSEEDGTVNFDLFLSNYGGDKFSVKAAKDKDGKDNLVEGGDIYEVWKRLYYQVSKMKNSFAFPFDIMIEEYKSHNIELEKTSEILVPYKENLETDELAAYETHFKKKNTPYEAHVILIDRQCDSDEIIFVKPMDAQELFIEADLPEWPFSDWLNSAEAIDEDDNKATPTVTRKTVGGKKGIEIDLTGTGLDPTKTPVDIDVSFKYLKASYTGDATYLPNVFIAVGAPRSNESKNNTVGHEIGHALGMVPRNGHDLQYSNENGGSGSHCRHGATPDKKSKAQGGAYEGSYRSGECVMYHASSEHYKFCSTCKEFVKEADLSEDAMKARKWG